MTNLSKSERKDMMANGWPKVPLDKIVTPVQRPEEPVTGKVYRQIGVRLWGEGAYERDPIDGSQTQYKTLSRVEADDIIVNKIWARNGSVAVVSKDLAGCYASTEFPLFAPMSEKLLPRWFHWFTKTKGFWQQCDERSRGTSGKNRIRPEQFVKVEIPLPPLAEQQRIVARIEELAAKIEEVQRCKRDIEADLNRMLLSAYHSIADKAPRKPMEEVAPLTRRPANVVSDSNYPQVAVRSFGRGTFHKSALKGSEITWQKPFLVKSGDILISNIKAWEGAIAVATESDNGRYGSHRYLTCVPIPNVATSRFVCFHLLTPEGLFEIGEASPGSADRNRTLSAKTLMQIPIPVPLIEKQLWFDDLYAKVSAMRGLQAETSAELEALLPSVLDRAFKGEL
jgi:type I restriction enzyme S subunit